MTATTTSDRPARAARPQAVLSVRRREQLSAHLVRLVVGGPGFADFRTNEFTDKYAKLIFVDPELGLTPPYDLAALRESLPPESRPTTRTYTIRYVEPESQQLTIDFVVHGTQGIAAPWAARAEVGDVLTLSGAGGAYRPDRGADWHLFVGDESAVPAISAAVEALELDARGLVYLETEDGEKFLDAEPPAGLDVHWVPRAAGSGPEVLADAVLAGPWPDGRVGVFAHGERESMKAVRAAVKGRLGDGDRLSLSGYWARGRTEDVFQAEKRQPIGQIES